MGIEAELQRAVKLRWFAIAAGTSTGTQARFHPTNLTPTRICRSICWTYPQDRSSRAFRSWCWAGTYQKSFATAKKSGPAVLQCTGAHSIGQSIGSSEAITDGRFGSIDPELKSQLRNNLFFW